MKTILEEIERLMARSGGQPVMVNLNHIGSLKIAGRSHLPPDEQLIQWAKDKGWAAELNLPRYVIIIYDQLAGDLSAAAAISQTQAAELLNQFRNRRQALEIANQIANKNDIDLVTALKALAELAQKKPDFLDDSEKWTWAGIPKVSLRS